jgi:Beta propeller domain
MQTSRSTRKKLLWILLAVAAIVAFAVGLGVGLSNDDDNDNSFASNEISPSNAGNDTNDGSATSTMRLLAISPQSIHTSYSSCDALSADLTEAGRRLANYTIEHNIQWYFYPVIYGPATDMMGGQAEGAPINKVPTTEDSYGTNNQVDGVEEGDIVVSNGVQVFAAYGREILELDAASVTILSRTELPAVPATCYSDSIASMLLIDTRLVVMTYSYCDASAKIAGGSATSTSIVMGVGGTRVMFYDTTDMSLISTEALQGSYMSGRSIGNNVQIVASSWFNSYDTFTKYLDISNQTIYGAKPTESFYRNKARHEAESDLDGYVDQLTSELDCESMQKLALLQNTNDVLNFAGMLDSMATVYSFAASNASAT